MEIDNYELGETAKAIAMEQIRQALWKDIKLQKQIRIWAISILFSLTLIFLILCKMVIDSTKLPSPSTIITLKQIQELQKLMLQEKDDIAKEREQVSIDREDVAKARMQVIEFQKFLFKQDSLNKSK